MRTVNGLTKAFLCNMGIRQGDVSSPLLFALLINDLCTLLREQCDGGIFITEEVSDIFCLKIADDIAICADTRIRLQKQLNIISEFCQLTKMPVTLNKTEIIVFRNAGPLRSYDHESWTFNGVPVKTTSEYKYLGLIFTRKLSLSKAKRKLASHTRKSYILYKNSSKKIWLFSTG